MAAYCGCCGAEITLKAERCSVCGTPRHGMIPEAASSTVSCLQEKAPLEQTESIESLKRQ